jgi:hypothetical protein
MLIRLCLCVRQEIPTDFRGDLMEWSVVSEPTTQPTERERRLTVRVSASGPLTRPSELTFTLSRAVRGTARARPKVRKPLRRYAPYGRRRDDTRIEKGNGDARLALGRYLEP